MSRYCTLSYNQIVGGTLKGSGKIGINAEGATQSSGPGVGIVSVYDVFRCTATSDCLFERIGVGEPHGYRSIQFPNVYLRVGTPADYADRKARLNGQFYTNPPSSLSGWESFVSDSTDLRTGMNLLKSQQHGTYLQWDPSVSWFSMTGIFPNAIIAMEKSKAAVLGMSDPNPFSITEFDVETRGTNGTYWLPSRVTMACFTRPTQLLGITGVAGAKWAEGPGIGSTTCTNIDPSAPNVQWDVIMKGRGLISFRSVANPNIFLRMDGRGLTTDSPLPSGGGLVNGQFFTDTNTTSTSTWESFTAMPVPLNASMRVYYVRSLQFPKAHLRLGADGSVNCQSGMPGTNEQMLLTGVAGSNLIPVL